MITAGMNASDEISLLVDLGTNGEIVLGNRNWAASVSCASGPAFEGAGIRSGMRAMKGAIDHVHGDPVTGEIRWSTIGSTPARGICGSGIVDLAVAMVETGTLDFAGKLNFRHPRVRTGPDGVEYVLAQAQETGTGREIVITQQDIDYLMDSKAAACGAIAVLLKRYKYTVSDVRHLYLARGVWGVYRYQQRGPVRDPSPVPVRFGPHDRKRISLGGIRMSPLDQEPGRSRIPGTPHGLYRSHGGHGVC